MSHRLSLGQRVYLRLFSVHTNESLNDGDAPDLPPANVAARLRLAIHHLSAAGIDPQCGTVDYRALASSAAYQAYLQAAQMLCRFDLETLADDDQRKAFWLNVYNALIIHAVIAFGARDSIQEIRGVFDRAAYTVGGLRFSANDIEHGILRVNAGHPAIPGGQFSRRDPRLRHALRQIDPRIHCALVCAAQSCPPIGFYDAARLDAQLDTAARHFLASGNFALNRATMTVTLSRIFSWYAADFGAGWFGYRGQMALLRFVGRYAAAEDAAFIAANESRLRVRFLRYDWSLNDGQQRSSGLVSASAD
jgi:hypothetical protein